MKKTNPPLKRSRAEVLRVLNDMLKAYQDHRDVMKSTPQQARDSIIRQYDDFHDWLQGKVSR